MNIASTLSIIDLFIIFGFLVLTLSIGIYKGRNIKTIKEYAIGDRKFSTFILMATIFATLIGGNSTLGLSKKVFSVGIIVIISMMGFAVSYFIMGYLGSRMKVFEGKISTGEIMEEFYGKFGRISAGFFGFLFCAGLIAAQVGAMGYIFNLFLGVSYTYGTIIGFGIVVIYSAFGGVRAVTFTDAFQFSMIIASIPIIATEGVRHAGMWPQLFADINKNYPTHLNPFLDINLIKEYLPIFFVFCIPALYPSVVQRMLMAKNRDQVKKAFFITVGMTIFLFTIVGVIGLSALKLNPGLNPNFAFPYLLQTVLPIGLRGLAVAGIFAVIMSSSDSFLNGGSIALVHDFIKPICGSRLSEKFELFLVRITTLLTGIIAIFISIKFKDIMSMIIGVRFFWVPTITPAIIGTLLGYRTTQKRFVFAVITGILTLILMRDLIISKYSYIPLFAATLGNALVFFGPKLLISVGFVWPIHKLLKLASPILLWKKLSAYSKNAIQSLKKSGPVFPRIVSYYNKVTEEHGDMGVLFGTFMTLNIIIPYFMWQLESKHNDAWVTIRVASGMCCAILIFKERWSQKMLRYWGLFYHFALMVSLPTLAIFAVFDTEGSVYALLNVSISLLMLVLLADWKNFLFIGGFGAFFGWGIFKIVNIHNPLVGAFKVPQMYWDIFIYTTTFSLIVGFLFSRKRNERQKYLLQSAESMAGIIAHELRTPLATVSLAFNRLEEKDKNSKLPIDKEVSPVEITRQALGNANKFIDITLQNVRNPKKMNEFPVKLSVKECVEEAVETYPFSSEKAKNKVHVNINEDFYLSGTKLLVVHVIYNLLKNGTKAINSAGKGEIHIFSEKHIDINCLTIKDTGVGIPKHLLPNIMERFTTYWDMGTGLGLSFCKDAMRSMNGYINADSKESKYTKIMLFFPQYKEFSRSITLRKWPKNVVIVDDDIYSLKTWETGLKETLEFESLTTFDDSLSARMKLNEIFHNENSAKQVSAVIANVYDGVNFFKAIHDRQVKRIWITDIPISLEDTPHIDVILKNDSNTINNLKSELNWPKVPEQLKRFRKYRSR